MIYLFKIYRRSTALSQGFCTKLLEVDGIGLFVMHNSSDELKPEIIRRYLIGRSEHLAWLQAPDPKSFKEYFYWSYEGARVGKKPAEWVNTNYPILEIPDCNSIDSSYELTGYGLRCDKTTCSCILNNMGWEEDDDYCPVKQVSDLYYEATRSITGGPSRYQIALSILGIKRFGLKEEIIDGFKFIRKINRPEFLPLFDGVL